MPNEDDQKRAYASGFVANTDDEVDGGLVPVARMPVLDRAALEAMEYTPEQIDEMMSDPDSVYWWGGQ